MSETTESPLSNMTSKEKIDFVRNQYGDEIAKKVAEDEINKKIFEVEQNYLLPEEIENKTEHLPNFELIKQVFSLQGEEYLMCIKDSYKSLISLSVPEHLRIIRIGEIKTDLRVHPSIVLSSGKGKKNICEGIRKIYTTFKPDANIKQPRSIHYQQLIGKKILRKEKIEEGETRNGTPKYKIKEEWITKKGFLGADLLIFEEAYELFNSMEKNDVDCRDAILVALDCYGDNLIQKQNIDNLDTKEETLEYFPYVTLISFFQPLMCNETFVTKGLSRRLSINYKEFPERTKLDKYVNRLTSTINDIDSCRKFAVFMKKINSIKSEWSLSPEAFETFTICHASLLEQGFRQGGKIAHYTRILEFPMQNLLLKISALQSLSNLRTEITKEDVENAFVDIIERLTFEFLYVDKKVKGTLDYGESWGGATGKLQECLEELHSLGCVDKETSVKIYVFQNTISKIFDISVRRARDKYNEMKQSNLIKDFKGQKGDNGVWLNFEPRIKLKDEQKQEEELNPKDLYFKLSGRTDKSARTLRTGKTQKINPDNFIYIYDSDDKSIPSKGVQTDKIVVANISTPQDNSLGVLPVLPVLPHEEKSDRDTQYYKSKECENIQMTCTKEQVQDYKKQHPEATTEDFYKEFGAGVLTFKKEGLF